jgi:sulfite exporter TauE/SafE
MITNVGRTDQWVRIVVGLVLVALGLWYGSWWGAIGLIPLLTGLFRWCPVYKVFRTSTAHHPQTHG